MSAVFIGLAGKLRYSIEKTIPGHKAIYKKKLLHMQAIVLVELLWGQILSLEDSQITDILRSPSQVLFIAAEFGVVELITELIQSYPDLIWRVDEHSRSIFHMAVIHRQEKIFRLIHDIGALKDMIAAYKDKNNHCILHLAGKIAPPNRLNIVSGAALQMQRELLWFKEVEKNVQPLYKEMRDINGRTPRMLFTEEHAKLVKEGEKWMKSTASSCMLVATLITTVMFAAIFTVPGGNDNEKGTPLFLEAKSFIIFAISDALALFSSVTSILMFLSILTSRYAEEDFLRLLPQRLIVGLATLFLSIAAMLVAFGATFCIVLSQRLAWIAVPAALIACIPVTLFAFLQFPLLVDMIQSSNGAVVHGYRRPPWNEDGLNDDIQKLDCLEHQVVKDEHYYRAVHHTKKLFWPEEKLGPEHYCNNPPHADIVPGEFPLTISKFKREFCRPQYSQACR
ncbi:PGG domain - like 10 [Theobroma cacao]|nr:PGG domain - like 10 [Theobroma cacao]